MPALLLSLLLLSGPDAPAPSAPPALELPRASPELGSLVAPALLLVAAAAALVLARRRRGAARLVQVLETTPLGGRRSLVVARLGDELLLLGSSEAGVTLLRSQPAAHLADAARQDRVGVAQRAAPAEGAGTASPRDLPAALAGLAARLRPSRAAPPSPPFADLLAESAEDQELRRKLARGERGIAR